MRGIDHPMSRRTFVGSLAAALAAAWLVLPACAPAEKDLIRKAIPGTGETLPVIGLGTSRTFDVGNDEAALSDLAEVLQAFFANGGELIDSSPMYGTRSGGRRAAEAGRSPRDLFAATKVWTDGREAGIRQMEDSRRKWGIAAST